MFPGVDAPHHCSVVSLVVSAYERIWRRDSAQHPPASRPVLLAGNDKRAGKRNRFRELDPALAGPEYSPQKTLSVSSPVATTSGCRLPQALFVPAPFKNFRLPHICGMSTNVKVFSVGRLVKK